MRWIVLLGSLGAVAAAFGCGGSVTATSSAGAGSGDGAGGSGAAPAGSTGGSSGSATGGSGGGEAGWSDGLAGHYMQRRIGNCINVEEWWTFTPPAQVVETLVDRDFCGPHSIASRAGSYDGSGSAQSLALLWNESGRYTARRFTAALVDSYPSPLPMPSPDGYVQGSGALNAMGYVRAASELIYRRDEKFVYAPDGQNKKRTKLVRLSVAFQAPLQAPPSPEPCMMDVSAEVRIYHDEPADPQSLPDDQGHFDTSLPCTYALDTSTPWVRVTADGFEQSDIDGTWMEYVDHTLGIAAMYSGEVCGGLEEAFRPILYFEATKSDVLFHDVGFAWYMAMQSPPPASAD